MDFRIRQHTTFKASRTTASGQAITMPTDANGNRVGSPRLRKIIITTVVNGNTITAYDGTDNTGTYLFKITEYTGMNPVLDFDNLPVEVGLYLACSANTDDFVVTWE